MPPTDEGQNRQSLESVSPQASVYVDTSSLEGTPAPVKPEYTRRRPSLFKFNKLAAIVTGAAFLIIGLIVGSALIFTSIKNGKDSTVTSQKGKFQVTKLNVSNINQNLQVDSADKLSVNGQLKVSNTLVLAPTSAPTAPTTGQIYYNKTDNALYYYNGSTFVPIANNNSVVSSLGGMTGAVNAGTGLSAVAGSLQNTGVLTVQGASGNVNFTAGGGVVISGTTISTVALPAGQLVLGTGSSGFTSVAQASTPGQCLISTSGAPVFGSCTGTTQVTSLNGLVNGLTLAAGAGVTITSNGVNTLTIAAPAAAAITSVNGQSGPSLTVANATGSGNTITINNAAADGSTKGIAAFNTTNFSGSSGVIDTIQGISTSASPTFANLNSAGYLKGTELRNASNVVFTLPVTGSGTSRTLCYVDNTNASNCPTGGNISSGTAQTPNYLTKFDSGTNQITNSELLVLTGGLQYAGTGYLLDLVNGSDSTLTVDNSGAGVANLAISGKLSASQGLLNGSDTFLIPTNGGNGGTLCYVYSGSSNCPTGGNVSFGTTHTTNKLTAFDGSGNLVDSELSTLVGGVQYTGTSYLLDLTNASNSTLTVDNSGAGVANLSVSGSVTANGGLILASGKSLQAAAGGIDINSGTGAGDTITFYTANGANSFILPTTGGLGQTICTTAITCASGGGQAVLLDGTSAQTSANTKVGIFISKAAGASGNLLQLQYNTSDRFVINNQGELTSYRLAAGTAGTDYVTVSSATQSGVVNLSVPTVSAGNYDICLSSGNCAGTGGGITGSGTNGNIAMFTGGGTIANSALTQAGGDLSATGNLTIQGSGGVTIGASGVNGKLSFTNSTNGNKVTLQGGVSASDFTLTLPTGDGTASQCLATDGAGQLIFQTCLSGGGGGGGVTFFNTRSGAIILQGTTNQVAITESPSGTFTLSLPQSIHNAATPTFAGLTLSGLSNGIVTSASGLLSGGVLDRNSASYFNTTLSVANGGTGTTSLTSNGVLYGNSGGAIQATAAGTNGQLLVGNTSAAPGFVTLSGDASITNTGVLTVNKLQTTTLTLGSLSSGDVLQYNGTALVNGKITNSNLTAGTFSSITGTGTLTAGAIGSGFGVISTGNNITTTAALQGASASITGASGVTIGGSGVTGALKLGNSSSTDMIILQGSNPTGTGDVTISFPANLAAGTDEICLLTAGNCVGAGGGVTSSGGTTDYIPRYTGATTLTKGTIFDNGTTVVVGGSTTGGGLFNVGTTNQFQVSSAGAVTAVGVNSGAGLLQGSGGLTATGAVNLNNTGSGVTQIGSGSAGNITLQSAGTISLSSGATAVSVPGSGGLRVGVANSVQGKLILSTAGAGSITLLAPSLASNYDVSIPGTITGNDTICLQNTANCSGGSLQTAYTASTGSTTPEIRLDNVRNGVDIQDADTTLGANTSLFAVRSSATSSTLGTAMFSVTGSGTAVHQTTTNNGAAFQVLNATSSPVVNVDTYNNMFTAGSAYYSSGTISQTGSTVTGSGTSWVSGMAAGIVIYSDGTVATINTVNSATSLSVSVSKTVTAGSSYTIRWGGLNVFKSTGGAYLQTTLDNTAAFLIQNSNAFNLFTADTANMQIVQRGSATISGGLQVNGLSLSGAPTITNVGTAGSTTYTYVYTARNANGGETTGSLSGTTATGNATLNVTNYNRITFNAIAGAKDYRIYRTVGGATQGLIGTTSTVNSDNTVTFNDTGLSGTGSVPTNNTSGNLSVTGNTLLKPITDNTTAFQIQNAGGTSILAMNSVTADRGGNFVVNGSFETDVSNWTRSGGAGMTRSTSFGLYGTASMFLDSSNVAMTATGNLTGSLAASTTYTLSYYTYTTFGLGQTLSATIAGTTCNASVLSVTWVKNTCTFTTPVSPTYNTMVFNLLDVGFISNYYGVYIDGVRIEAGGTAYPYQQYSKLSVNGDIDITGAYLVNGSPLASTYLSDSANIARLDATQTFTGYNTFKNTSNSTTAFKIQNASGTEIFNVDTTNGKIGTANQTANSTNSTSLVLKTGDATGLTSNSGNLTIDTGSATQTAGSVSIGTGAYAHNTFIGNSTGTTALSFSSGTGGATFGGANSNNAFRIQNASGANFFKVDTLGVTRTGNFVSNGTFETDLSGWSGGSIVRSNTQSSNGSWSGSLNSGGATVTTTGNLNATLLPSTTYILSYDVYSAAIGIGNFTPTIAGTTCPAVTAANFAWTRYTCTFTTPASPTYNSFTMAYLDNGFIGSYTPIYFDAIRVEAGSVANSYAYPSVTANANTVLQNTTNGVNSLQILNSNSASVLNIDTIGGANLLSNGDFEAAGSTGWAAKGSASIAQSAVNQWQGNNSLMITTTTSANDGAKFNYTMTNGQAYTLSFYARSITGGSYTDLAAGRQDDGSTDTNCTLSSTNVSTSWTRYTCTFTAGAQSGTPAIYIKKTGATAETIFIDGVQLQTGSIATAFNAGGALQVGGIFNSPVAVQNKQDSSTAFLIQNSTGTNLLAADTTNMRISVGSRGTATSQLYVAGSTPSGVTGQANGTYGSNGIAVQGRYVYTVPANGTNGYLQVYDTSNPAAPVYVDSGSPNKTATSSAATGKKIKIQGKYAYVAGGNTLQVFDISNPYAPVSVGTQTYTSAGSNAALYVQGRYAYVGVSGTPTLYVFDISNPAAIPSATTVSIASASNGPYDIYAQGRYVYIANGGGTNPFQIIDMSNPTSPSLLSSIGSGTISAGAPQSIVIQGRYAYLGTTTTLYTIDVSNPATPSLANTLTLSGAATYLTQQSRYLYAVDSSGVVRTIDISTPATPTLLTGTTTAQSPLAVQVSGRYLYVANNSGTNTLQIFDMGGTYTQQLEAGGVETDQLSVRGNASFASDASIQGSLAVGSNANIQGSLAVGGTSKFTGNLLANNYATATATYSTTVAATTNTTSVTVNSATGFATGDVIFIDNAGQDYFTRITNIATNTFTVSPAVSVDANSGATPAVTKYVTQSLGVATNSALATPTLGDRFFQGYFLGGVVTGAGSTTLSDGSLASTGIMNYSATSHSFTSTATTQNALSLAVNGLTTGSALNVSTSSANFTSGNLAVVSQTGTYTNPGNIVTGNTFNVSRALVDNTTNTVGLDGTPTGGALTVNTSNSNRVVAAIITTYNGTINNTPTYNGVAMTLGGSVGETNSTSFNYMYTYIYYVTGNPTSGSLSFTTTGGSSTYRLYSLYNVNQTSPLGPIASNSVPTNGFGGTPITVTSASGELVITGTHGHGGGASNPCSVNFTYPATNVACVNIVANAAAGFSQVGGAASVNQQVAYSGYSDTAVGIIGVSIKKAGLSVTGSVANISSNCTNGTIGCVDSSSVLNLNQQFSSASGAVLNIQNASSSAADIQIGSSTTGKIQTAAGTTTNGINIQSGNATTGNSGAATLQSGSSASANSGLVTVASGNAGSGTSGGISISTGTGSAASGNISLTTGSASNTSGSINIAAGGAFTSGTITLQTYTASFGTGGAINIKTNGDANGTSGAIQLTTGGGGASGGINIDAGQASFTQGSILIGNGAYSHSTTVGNQTGTSALNLYSGTGNVNIIAASTGTVKVSLGTTASTNAVCSTLANATSPTAATGYSLVDCNAAPAADYAERYPIALGATYGDIVAVGNQMVNTYDTTNGTIDWGKVKGQVTQLVKTNSAYQSNTIGIVSDNYGDFTSAGANIKDEDNPMPVALAGRVPVKVAAGSDPIQPGDYLTTSTEAGKAMKASGAGYVIGKALASWIPGSGETVMVYVEPGYYQGETIADMIQNGSNANLNNLTVSGNLTVTGVATFQGNIIVGGHIITQGDTPTATINSAAGAGAVCTVSGNDTAGQITITTGSGGWAGGEQCAINFSNSYSSAPRPVITPANGSDTSIVKPFVDVPGSAPFTSWNLNFINADSGQHTYKFNYFNVQ